MRKVVHCVVLLEAPPRRIRRKPRLSERQTWGVVHRRHDDARCRLPAAVNGNWRVGPFPPKRKALPMDGLALRKRSRRCDDRKSRATEYASEEGRNDGQKLWV